MLELYRYLDESILLGDKVVDVSVRGVWFEEQLLLLLLFLTFSALVANPKKTTYTVANPARGLLNRGKKKKMSGSAPLPPPPHARCLFGEKKKKKKNNHAAHPHV